MWWFKRIWAKFFSNLSTTGGFAGEEEDPDNVDSTGDTADNVEYTGKKDEAKAKSEEGEEGEESEESEESSPSKEADEELSKLFGKDFNKLGKSYRELQKIHKPTEMENAAIKNWAKKMGLKANYGESGSFEGFSVEKPVNKQESQKRFTDEHRKNLVGFFSDEKAGNTFLDLLSHHIHDVLTEGMSAREQEVMKSYNFNKQVNETWDYVTKVWPEVNPNQEGFPEGGSPLYNLASKIYNKNEDYQRHPKGMLFATAEAATQLGMSPQKIKEARQDGEKNGLEKKRILGKFGASETGSGKPKSSSGEVSMAEFIAMTPSQRAKYTQNQMKTGG